MSAYGLWMGAFAGLNADGSLLGIWRSSLYWFAERSFISVCNAAAGSE